MQQYVSISDGVQSIAVVYGLLWRYFIACVNSVHWYVNAVQKLTNVFTCVQKKLQ